MGRIHHTGNEKARNSYEEEEGKRRVAKEPRILVKSRPKQGGE